jgi:myosin heavy subunit
MNTITILTLLSSNTQHIYVVKALVQSIKENQENYHLGNGVQVGKSKVFLRHQAHELLEKLRREKFVSAAIIVQKTVRKYLSQRFKARAISSLIKMQSFVRKVLAESAVGVMRSWRSSITIQKSWRKHSARKKILSVFTIAYWCQTHYRGIVGRKSFHGLKRDHKALRIQSRWRGQCALKRFQTQRKASILIQCAVRCRTARSKLVAMKAESRDLNMLIQERDRLREEVQALRNELNEIKCTNEANHILKSDVMTSEATVTSEAIDFEVLSKVQAKNELEKAKTTISVLESDRCVAPRREEVNTVLQKEFHDCAGFTIDYTDITEVISLRAALDQLANDKEIAEYKLEEANKEILSLKCKSGTDDRDLIPTDTDVTEIMFLRDALELLAKEKELAENEILALKSEREVVTLDRDDLRQVNKIIQSELTLCEEELCRVKESLEDVKKQNIALASSKFVSMDPRSVNHDYIMPIASEYSIGNTVPDWEDESRIVQLEDINVETNRSNRQSMYELDDLKRINRSLREDLEATISEMNAIAKELNEKCVEFNELNDDVEKFAEAFAAQHSEIQKLQFENKRLKALASKSNISVSR